jgi:hypothetical protein
MIIYLIYFSSCLKVLVLKVDWRLLLTLMVILIFLVDFSTRLDSTCGTSNVTGHEPTLSHFGHLEDVSIPISNLHSSPRVWLFIQVINKTRFFETLLGIGFIALPIEPGRYDLTLSTMKPVGFRNDRRLTTALNDYYFGLPKMDISNLISSFLPKVNMDGSMFDKNGRITEPSGSVLLNLEISHS